jgi:hypothetical protein
LKLLRFPINQALGGDQDQRRGAKGKPGIKERNEQKSSPSRTIPFPVPVTSLPKRTASVSVSLSSSSSPPCARFPSPTRPEAAVHRKSPPPAKPPPVPPPASRSPASVGSRAADRRCPSGRSWTPPLPSSAGSLLLFSDFPIEQSCSKPVGLGSVIWCLAGGKLR